MERTLGFLLMLIGTLSVIHTVQAQSQSQEGFISLDCGLPANELSPYTEATTGLQFSSDATFIQSGKIGTTTPLISALEIRPMGNNSYITKSGSLSLLYRVYLSDSVRYIRYPHDIYDRQWHPYFEKSNWTEISTNRLVRNNNSYDPPRLTLATAAIPTHADEPLKIEWSNPEKPDAQYYLYRHFAEIQDLQRNEIREFNMVWNGEVLPSDPVIPKNLAITTVLSASPRTCDKGECSLQLVRTSRSTLPPLLNAIEVYTVIQFPL
ncbi:hypothetical protein AALP_AA8G390800 [Arabis alpina]|uniref:Malectin-like domain-containing protein n=1 Tax=Arabis alpina TaxID=50452 RepID=A0A087GC97_ARAAL|nr:hypothetical protein AALP_AA8G390800 [Arabis alpina]